MLRWILLGAVALAGCADTRGTGVVDTDEDGVPDSSDACPDEPEDVDGDSDDDGCPEGASTYAYCLETADCTDPEDVCVELTVPAAATSGRLCTRTCASQAECPPGLGFSGACYDVENSGVLLCYQTCEIDADCRAGSVCVQVVTEGATDFICLPDN